MIGEAPLSLAAKSPNRRPTPEVTLEICLKVRKKRQVLALASAADYAEDVFASHTSAGSITFHSSRGRCAALLSLWKFALGSTPPCARLGPRPAKAEPRYRVHTRPLAATNRLAVRKVHSGLLRVCVACLACTNNSVGVWWGLHCAIARAKNQ